ncbi:MAG: VWA domain-containing protein [Nannocystaceae bacterium]
MTSSLAFSGAGCGNETPAEATAPLESPPGVVVEIYQPIELTDDARLPEAWPGLVRVDVAADRLVFSFEDQPPASLDLAIGNVVAGQSHGGYLRRVAAMRREGARIVVDTVPATLVELIERGHFEATFDPDVSEWDAVPRAGTLPLISRVVENFDCSVGQLPSAQMGVFYDTNTGFHLEIEISDSNLERASFSMTGSQELGAQLDVDSSFEASCTRDLLGEVDRQWRTIIPVGWLPIPVTHTLSPSAEVEVTGSMSLGAVSAQASTGFQLTAGAEYEDQQWRGLWQASALGSTSLDKDDGSLSLRAGLTAGLTYTVELFDAVGPRIGISPSAEGSFSLDSCEYSAELEAGIEGTIGAVVGVPLLDITLAELEIGASLGTSVVDAHGGVQLGCEEPVVDDVQPVSASGSFDERGGVLEVAVSPTDSEGNFIGHGLSVEDFAFTAVTMTPESGLAPISLTTTVEAVVVNEPDPGAAMTAVVVFDSSGSMTSNDPGASGRRAGARAFFDELTATDSVAVLDFGAGVTPPLVASRLLQDFTSDPALLEASLDLLTESRGTPLYESLIDALSLLEPLGQGGVVVVLTDGQDGDSLATPDTVIGQAAAQGVQIFAVGLGDALGFAELRAIGNGTGGAFVEASDAALLEQTFTGISAGIKVGRVTVLGRASYPPLDTAPSGRHAVAGTLETQAIFQTPFEFTVDIDNP